MTRASARFAMVVLLVASLVAVVTACGGTKARKAGDRHVSPISFDPQSIAFWDRQHGLVAGADAKRGVGAILATSDGGRTFHVVLQAPSSVGVVTIIAWVRTAGPSDAWALEARSCPELVCALPAQLLHSGDRGKSWQTVPNPKAIYNVSFASKSRGMATTTRGRFLTTSDGGRSWSASPRPCPRSENGGGDLGDGTYLSLATPRHAWTVCTGEPGAGNQQKTIYASANGGKVWRIVANQRGAGLSQVGSGGLASYGYPQGISFTPQGHGLLWESRGLLYLTRDGGRHWKTLGVVKPELDFGLSAAMLSKTRAFVLLEREGNYRLLATADGGRSWSVVQRWPG